ncbi:MAG: TrmH family RNA methyltransferase [Gemmatimonadota bacterium]
MSDRPEPSNAGRLVERFRAARGDPRWAVLEGFHPLKHALRFGAEIVVAATVDPDRVTGLARALAPELIGRIETRLVPVPPQVFERLVPTPPSTAVVAIARRPVIGLTDVLAAAGDAPVVLLENPARLGNLGAAVRVAAAAGAAGLIAVGSHDPWHPEALRGGAGLQFALPVARVDSLPTGDRGLGSRQLVAIDPTGEPLCRDRIAPGAVLAFGSERQGLSSELLGRAELQLAIPMREGVSSLNLATAVAVLLYACRSREAAPGRSAE